MSGALFSRTHRECQDTNTAEDRRPEIGNQRKRTTGEGRLRRRRRGFAAAAAAAPVEGSENAMSALHVVDLVASGYRAELRWLGFQRVPRAHAWLPRVGFQLDKVWAPLGRHGYLAVTATVTDRYVCFTYITLYHSGITYTLCSRFFLFLSIIYYYISNMWNMGSLFVYNNM